MEIQEIRASRSQYVVKANELIQQSRFDLSIQQQKIILYLISRIKPTDADFIEYEFSIAEFCRICGIDYKNGQHYIDLKRNIKEIADRSLWVRLPNGEETLLRWIEKPYINGKSGTIRIRLDRDMKPFLLDLKERYTQYELIYTLFFKSKYTIRLYEYIKSVHYNEDTEYHITVSIDELRRILGAENYKDANNFKRRALLPACMEINEYSDKTVSIYENTAGKRIVSFRLDITTKNYYSKQLVWETINKAMDADQLSLFDEGARF